jgi:hypothetical protein
MPPSPSWPAPSTLARTPGPRSSPRSWRLPSTLLGLLVAPWACQLALAIATRPGSGGRLGVALAVASRLELPGSSGSSPKAAGALAAAVAMLVANVLADLLAPGAASLDPGRGRSRPCRRRRLPRRCGRLADPGAAFYRRARDRPDPAAAPVVTIAAALDDPAAWNAFVQGADPGSYLQLGPWAEVKRANGWRAARIGVDVADGAAIGAQVLLRRPGPLPWAFAYAPRGPVTERWRPELVGPFTEAARATLSGGGGRVSHLRVDPEVELDGPPTTGVAAGRAARAGARRRRSAAAAAHDLRRRDDPLERPSQEVAAIRQPRPDLRRDRRGRRRGGARALLRDLPGDGGPSGLPHPDRGRLPRHLERLSAARPGPNPHRPRPGRRPAPRCSSSLRLGSWSRTAG